MINYEKIGDYPYFNILFQTGTYAPGALLGRICAVNRGRYKVAVPQGIVEAVIPGTLPSETGQIVTGDWVALTEEQGTFVIRALLPRKNYIARQTAGKTVQSQLLGANISVVFIVTGLDNNFNPRRIERFLTLVGPSGAQRVVLLNKVDLCSDAAEKVQQVRISAPGVPVHTVSALQEEGLELIKGYLGPGKTAVFLGSSGVGKSTLINKLIQTDMLKTAEVREKDSKGRHTTTGRELFFLESGGVLMDTPGLREIQLLDNQEGLEDTFPDILKLAGQCKFSNCTHGPEPGCAVRAALEKGTLDPGRLGNYLKMEKEIEYYNRQVPKWDSKKKWKDIAKLQKQFSKKSPKYNR